MKRINLSTGLLQIILVVGLIFFFGLILNTGVIGKTKTKSIENNNLPSLPTVEDNSIIAVSNHFIPYKVIKIKAIITAYSSSPWETDDDPYITASGKLVRDGIIANNKFPFGTKVKIPSLYGDKIFVVEDRMSWEKSPYHFDIWMDSYQKAKNFGAKRTIVEVLED